MDEIKSASLYELKHCPVCYKCKTGMLDGLQYRTVSTRNVKYFCSLACMERSGYKFVKKSR